MAGSLRQPYNFVSPVLAVHADWSVSPAKRWMSVARREGGRWRIGAPEPVGEAATLAARLLERAAGAAVALGVDFPLGLPRAYARAAGIDDFAAWLARLDPAAPLFHPCANLAEISLGRPFYPLKTVAGAGQMARLAAALGLDDAASLRRAVDCRTARRPAGAPLFWTMGPTSAARRPFQAGGIACCPPWHRGSHCASGPLPERFTTCSHRMVSPLPRPIPPKPWCRPASDWPGASVDNRTGRASPLPCTPISPLGVTIPCRS
ncbi:unnamed protein product [Acidocella sp. C78]|nr:unnamed protein product [Acidocella sp. C78]